MAREIERRFLVDPRKLPKLRPGISQIQGYLNTEIDKKIAEVRVRVENSKATLTIKYLQSSLTRLEFEYEIPLKDGQDLLKLTDKKITKVRHNLTLSGKKWEIDFFQERNFPLVIAEIELKSEVEEVTLPLWITKEITEKRAYTAMMLAFKPFQSWKKKDINKN